MIKELQIQSSILMFKKLSFFPNYCKAERLLGHYVLVLTDKRISDGQWDIFSIADKGIKRCSDMKINWHKFATIKECKWVGN